MNAGIRIREWKEKNFVICIERICLSEKNKVYHYRVVEKKQK